jgi:hypothetical protein
MRIHPRAPEATSLWVLSILMARMRGNMGLSDGCRNDLYGIVGHRAAFRGRERERFSRWFETAVTAVTGLAAILLVSVVAVALGLS